MSTLMSDEVAQKARELSAIRGFDNPNDYLLTLLDQDEADANSYEDMEDEEEIERLLQEGLDSGPCIPVTEDYWKKLRERVHAE